MISPLMVINNFYRICIFFFPDKTNAPLVIDSYAMLTFSISF